MKKILLAIMFIIVVLAGVQLSTGKLNAFSDPVKYKELSIDDFSLKLQLPETSKVSNESFRGEDVPYSAFIKDDKLQYWGYVQLWNIDNLDMFLKYSKANSTFNVTSYNRQEIKLKSNEGYLVTWTATFSDKRTVSGQEYFLRKDRQSTQVLRISLFKYNGFTDQLNQVVNTTASSIQWN